MKSREESGFTLIELLVATVILGVISFALTESVISGFDNTGATEERLVDSLDRQRVTAAFVPDVQSADPFDPLTPACEGTDLSPSVVIKLGWSDDTGEKLSTYLEVVEGSQTRLIRRYCENGTLEESELAEYEGQLLFECPVPGNANQCYITVPSKPKPFTILAERRAA